MCRPESSIASAPPTPASSRDTAPLPAARTARRMTSASLRRICSSWTAPCTNWPFCCPICRSDATKRSPSFRERRPIPIRSSLRIAGRPPCSPGQRGHRRNGGRHRGHHAQGCPERGSRTHHCCRIRSAVPASQITCSGPQQHSHQRHQHTTQHKQNPFVRHGPPALSTSAAGAAAESKVPNLAFIHVHGER